MSRRFLAALILIALAGLTMRISAVNSRTMALSSPTGYDDGVYFSASASLLRGVLPYRDFVFVHPPGILYAVAPVSWIPDPRTAFAAARMLSALVGGANIFLVGVVVARASGPIGGLVAALLYAGYPDAVVAERSVYLEPMLNLGCLLSAAFWLRRRADSPAPRPIFAGIAAGLACAVKFWGGIWVVAALASAGRGQLRNAARFIGAAAVTGFLALAPLALPAPSAFVEQTLRFQVSRPPDGVSEKKDRLRDIADSGHRAATVLAIAGLLIVTAKLVRRSGVTAPERFFTVSLLLTVAAFLASSSYWSSYNANLAASQCAVAGLAAGTLVNAARRYRAVAAIAVFALILTLDLKVWRAMKRDVQAQSGELVTVAHTVPSIVPRDASFFSFDPTWSVVSGRLPEWHGDAPPIVDSYGAMLLAPVRTGRRFRDTNTAFHAGVRQPEVRARLEASRFVLLGGRGLWQLDISDRDWFASRFRCVNPEAEELCVWERRAGAPVDAAPLESQLLQFGEGWYGREGVPPVTWRWMSRRSLTLLPPLAGKARLELELEVPLDVVAPPSISILLGDRELDRFVASEPKIARAYEVDGGGSAPHPAVITSDRSFVPAAGGRSNDTRELSLKLTRIAWRPAAGDARSSRK